MKLSQARRDRLAAALQATAALIPFAEEHHQHRDAYIKGFRRVAVELCHGTWHTFERSIMTGDDPHVRQHPDRETANQYAKGRVLGEQT